MVHNGPLCLPTKGIMHLGELTGILFQMPAERDAVRHIRRVQLISLRRHIFMVRRGLHVCARGRFGFVPSLRGAPLLLDVPCCVRAHRTSVGVSIVKRPTLAESIHEHTYKHTFFPAVAEFTLPVKAGGQAALGCIDRRNP